MSLRKNKVEIDMKLKEMRVTVRANVNMGNYESVHFEYGETLILEPGDDLRNVQRNCIQRCTRTVEREVLTARADLKAAQQRRKQG